MLELTIVIIMISILLAIAIDRLLKLQVQAERAAMENIIGSLQSAIALTISEHIAKDKIPELKKYIGSNPMDLLVQPPVNYLGSFKKPPQNPERASWWFDGKSNTLNYSVMNKDYVVVQEGNFHILKFKILPVYDDKNRNGRFDQTDALKGMQIKALTPYKWSAESLAEQ